MNGQLVDATLAHWLGFGAVVAVLLVLDLGVFHRHSRETTVREAAWGTLMWCSLALVFNALLWFWQGFHVAQLFLTGYLIEWSLSIDNVFVFAVIFGYFKVPKKYQYRILFWGILGAVAMRLTFVMVGGELLERFHWMAAVFGIFLVYTGVKLAVSSDSDVDPEHNPVLRLARKLLPIASGDHGERFFVRLDGKLCVTPLFLVLLVVESTDVLFAVDSVPAIFGITQDRFIVFTSNIFAILGLRALYFLLAGVMDMFRYLHYGLAAILVFIGTKMIIKWWDHHWWPLPDWASLVVIASLIAVSIVASIVAKRREDRHKGALTDGTSSPS